MINHLQFFLEIKPLTLALAVQETVFSYQCGGKYLLPLIKLLLPLICLVSNGFFLLILIAQGRNKMIKSFLQKYPMTFAQTCFPFS